GPALRDGDQQPMAIVGKRYAGPVFGVAALAENQLVGVLGMLLGILGDFVIVNVAVVHLLAVGDFAFFWIARVVEAGVVELPRNRGGARALDRVGKNGTRFGFDDVQRAHFGAAGRGAVGDILSGLAGIVPVE